MSTNLVIGYFGFRSNKLDGQTVKTRNFYALLKELDASVRYFDTEDIKYKKTSIFKLLVLILQAKKIYYLPAHNSLKSFFPWLYKVAKVFNKKIYYFMVGGWLSDFLTKNTEIKNMLGKIENVFCETHTIKNELEEKFDFQNLDYFPNFRETSFQPTFRAVDNEHIKIVYMGRINEGKGILDLFEIERRLSALNTNNYTIDLYGQIQKDFEKELQMQLNASGKIQYKGVLNPNEIYATLDKYDLMVFPTHFYTEGLPGTVLDAYLSGIPVLASNWKHAQEFIEDPKTGFIYEFDNIDNFENSIVSVLKNPSCINNMKKHAFDKSQNCGKEYAKELLIKISKSN